VNVGKGGYVQIDLSELGEVWATAHPTDAVWQEYINDDPYSIEILGWGQAPTVWWHELSKEQQDLLMTTL
jgi:hypothetical protein